MDTVQKPWHYGEEVVYQIEAYKKTTRAAADEFASTNFQEPRKVRLFNKDTFRLVDGISTYTVRLTETADGLPVYQITRY